MASEVRKGKREREGGKRAANVKMIIANNCWNGVLTNVLDCIEWWVVTGEGGEDSP